MKTILNLEDLSTRLTPDASWEGYTIQGFTGPLTETTGDFRGVGADDTAIAPADASGGSAHLEIFSGSANGDKFVPSNGPGSVLIDPNAGKLLFNNIIFPDDFRGGCVIAAIWSPALNRDLLAVSPGVGGGPYVALIDCVTGDVTTSLMFDANYRGGLTLSALPTPDDAGHTDSLLMAVPRAGGGGGAVASIFDSTGNIVSQFATGPADFRMSDSADDSYQPVPAEGGVQALDGTTDLTIGFFTPAGVELLGYDGVNHPVLIDLGGPAT